MGKRRLAEFLGTFWLVLGGCGSAVLAAASEFVLTAFFLVVIHGITDKRAPAGFAPLAIGLCLTLIHLISIPVTNTSVNPARSTGVALFLGSWAIGQLWMFWLVPLLGGIAGGLVYRYLGAADRASRHGDVLPSAPASAA